jgi:hypothetical protein
MLEDTWDSYVGPARLQLSKVRSLLRCHRSHPLKGPPRTFVSLCDFLAIEPNYCLGISSFVSLSLESTIQIEGKLNSLLGSLHCLRTAFWAILIKCSLGFELLHVPKRLT